MTPENFAYWLQGLFELSPDLKTLDEKQVEIIKQHLGNVFNPVIVQHSGSSVTSAREKVFTTADYIKSLSADSYMGPMR